MQFDDGLSKSLTRSLYTSRLQIPEVSSKWARSCRRSGRSPAARIPRIPSRFGAQTRWILEENRLADDKTTQVCLDLRKSSLDQPQPISQAWDTMYRGERYRYTKTRPADILGPLI